MEEGWFQRFPEQVALGLPHPSDKTAPLLTVVQMERVREAIESRKEKLKNWFRNERKKIRKGPTALRKAVTPLAKALLKKTRAGRRRAHQARELFQKRHADTINQLLSQQGFNEMNEATRVEGRDEEVEETLEEQEDYVKASRSERMRLKTKVVAELWANASPEERAEMKKEVEREKEMIAKAERDEEQKRAEGVHKMPQEYQEGINGPETMFEEAHAITDEAAGWVGMTLVGGPTPRLGGDLTVKVLCVGVTEQGNSFQEACADFEKEILGRFELFLRRVDVLTATEEAEKALPVPSNEDVEEPPLRKPPKRIPKPKKKTLSTSPTTHVPSPTPGSVPTPDTTSVPNSVPMDAPLTPPTPESWRPASQALSDVSGMHWGENYQLIDPDFAMPGLGDVGGLDGIGNLEIPSFDAQDGLLNPYLGVASGSSTGEWEGDFETWNRTLESIGEMPDPPGLSWPPLGSASASGSSSRGESAMLGLHTTPTRPGPYPYSGSSTPPDRGWRASEFSAFHSGGARSEVTMAGTTPASLRRKVWVAPLRTTTPTPMDTSGASASGSADVLPTIPGISTLPQSCPTTTAPLPPTLPQSRPTATAPLPPAVPQSRPAAARPLPRPLPRAIPQSRPAPQSRPTGTASLSPALPQSRPTAAAGPPPRASRPAVTPTVTNPSRGAQKAPPPLADATNQPPSHAPKRKRADLEGEDAPPVSDQSDTTTGPRLTVTNNTMRFERELQARHARDSAAREAAEKKAAQEAAVARGWTEIPNPGSTGIAITLTRARKPKVMGDGSEAKRPKKNTRVMNPNAASEEALLARSRKAATGSKKTPTQVKSQRGERQNDPGLLNQPSSLLLNQRSPLFNQRSPLLNQRTSLLLNQSRVSTDQPVSAAQPACVSACSPLLNQRKD
ncbi:hypothetical protein B0H11DRAFT_2234359 [Mycena galericulata]|nr:hypothetical protein B0H11DRAFT_2234359 [Mycena galericulata]